MQKTCNAVVNFISCNLFSYISAGACIISVYCWRSTRFCCVRLWPRVNHVRTLYYKWDLCIYIPVQTHIGFLHVGLFIAAGQYLESHAAPLLRHTRACCTCEQIKRLRFLRFLLVSISVVPNWFCPLRALQFFHLINLKQRHPTDHFAISQNFKFFVIFNLIFIWI